MTEAPKLLPCPFCGEELVNNGNGVWLHQAQSDSDCIIGAMGIMDAAKTIAAWSRRTFTPEAIASSPEGQALVAAAYEAAAKVADTWSTEAAEDIRKGIPADALTALERIKAEAREEGRQAMLVEALEEITAWRKAAAEKADGPRFQALDDLRWEFRAKLPGNPFGVVAQPR